MRSCIEGRAGVAGVALDPGAAQGRGEVLDEDLLAAGRDDEGALHLVAQLAQVARPRVDLEGAQGVVGEAWFARAGDEGAGLVQEVLREDGEVVPTAIAALLARITRRSTSAARSASTRRSSAIASSIAAPGWVWRTSGTASSAAVTTANDTLRNVG